MKKSLSKRIKVMSVIGLILLCVFQVKAYAGTDTKTKHVTKFDDGEVIVEIDKIQKIESGVEVFLYVTNNREGVFTFDKSQFYLLDDSKQDYSLLKKDKENNLKEIRAGAKNIVTLIFKDANIENSPFELRGKIGNTNLLSFQEKDKVTFSDINVED